MRNIIGLLFISFLFVLDSCVEDKYLIDGGTSYPELGENEYLFNLRLDDTGVRTRDVDFAPGAALRINKLWLGIFDIASGNLVSADSTTFGYQTITAGQTAYQFVHLKLDPPATPSDDGYIMVCVANHADVWTPKESNPNEKISLAQRLSAVTNWSNFINIAIDTESAYNDPHNLNVPVLAGFVYDDSKQATSHIKINQFKQTLNGKIELSPAQLLNSVKLKVHNNKYYTTDEDGNEVNALVTEGAAIHLRRLVANINVNIHVINDNLELERVDYMRYNMPTDVYIIERRTTNCAIEEVNGVLMPRSTSDEPGYFATGPDGNYDAVYSPNYSDANPSKFYKNDTDWKYGNIVGTDFASFSFQHFANKHWGDRAVFEKETDENGNTFFKDQTLNQASREEVNKGDTKAFKALVGENGTSDDFRNYASYFVLKLRLIEKNSGKAVETYYTIHEGNTSNELGNEVEGGNLQDFAVSRNIDYTYNVYVHGFDNIYHNVTVGNEGEHFWGQGGKIWEIDYLSDNPDQSYYETATGNYYNVIDQDGGVFDNAIKIQPGFPDISFRIYGFTDPDQWDDTYKSTSKIQQVATIQGFNYSMDEASFQHLNGLWPPSSYDYSHYIQSLDKMDNASQNTVHLEQIPPDLRDGLMFLNAEDSSYPINGTENRKATYIENNGMGIVEFITQFYNKKDGGDYEVKEQESELTFHVYIKPSNINNKKYLDRNKYLRAFYIADRNGVVDNVDGCTQLIKISAAVQYPDKITGQSFEMKGALDSNGKRMDHNGGDAMVKNELSGIYNGVNINGGSGMIFSSEPDLAFRLLGYNGNDFYDYCYNFELSDYPEFASYWPENSNAIVIGKESLESAQLNLSLLNALKIYWNSKLYKVNDFVKDYNGGVPTGFNAMEYNKLAIGNQKAYMRALYVFDKNAFRQNYIEDNKQFVTYQIYGIEQFPEEIPPSQLDWPVSLPNINVDKYNVIDPLETFTITIPVLSYVDKNGIGVGVGDYTTSLFIGSRDFSSYGELSSDEKNMVYTIPQAMLRNVGGDVYVQAISTSPFFINSPQHLIGSINLKHPDNIITNVWDSVLTTVIDSGSAAVSGTNLNGKFQYISFPYSGGFQRVSTNKTDGVKLANNNSIIAVKIYQPCNIKFVANGNGGTTNGINLYFDSYSNVDTYHARILPIASATTSTTSYNFEITEEDFEGKTEITIMLGRASGSGTNIKSFTITE